MFLRSTRVLHASIWIVYALAPLFVPAETAEAHIRKIVIEKKESPAFGGASFGAAAKAVSAGFLLQTDADTLIGAAAASDVLKASGSSSR